MCQCQYTPTSVATNSLSNAFANTGAAGAVWILLVTYLFGWIVQKCFHQEASDVSAGRRGTRPMVLNNPYAPRPGRAI
jgi:hypothetical protein